MVILEFISLALVIVLIAVLFLLRTRSQALRQQQQFLAQLCPQLEKQRRTEAHLTLQMCRKSMRPCIIP